MLPVGRSNARPPMATREWTIETPVRHDIRLEHGYVSGRARLYVDDNLVFERPTTIVDYGFEQELLVDGTPCVVRVRPTWWATFRYEFLANETLPEHPPTPPARKKQSIVPFVIAICGFGVFFLVRAFFVPPPEQVVMIVVAVVNFAVAVHVSIKRFRRSQQSDSTFENPT